MASPSASRTQPVPLATIEHLNAGWIRPPGSPLRVTCHCLLLRDAGGTAMIDTGIGLRDVADPLGRFGRPLIDAVGFQFDEADTAIRQLERRGVAPEEVKHVVLTHLDCDHAGGLADFPAARVHVAAEELAALRAGDPRYLPIQFEHGPRWSLHPRSTTQWFGLEARPIDWELASAAYLIPLFGHTAGHCGVAIQRGDRWLLHVGDAYYLRGELNDINHPIGALTAARAVDNGQRLASLERLRRLVREHGDQIDILGYHDIDELPQSAGGNA